MASFRKPKGIYQRNTPDWFALHRATQFIYYNAGVQPANSAVCVALMNNSAPGVYMHVLGVTIWQTDPSTPPPSSDNPPPIPLQFVYFARMSRTLVQVDTAPVDFLGPPPQPLYQEGKTPTGGATAGFLFDVTYQDLPLGPADGTTTIVYTPPWEIAAVAPASAWQIYCFNPFLAWFRIDYVWLVD